MLMNEMRVFTSIDTLSNYYILRGSHISLSWFSCGSSTWSNWNLEPVRTGERGEKPSEQGREPTTNSTHLWRRVRESNPGHIGGRRALSPLRHPCLPSLLTIWLANFLLSIWVKTTVLASVCHVLKKKTFSLTLIVNMVKNKLNAV